MLRKLLFSCFLTCICCGLCAAQVVLRRPIQPAVDTRMDVERTLGHPIRTSADNFFTYTPPAGYTSYMVQYRAGSDIVDRVEMTLATPVPREQMIQELRLPERPDATSVNAQGRLLEFFGRPAFMLLAYPSTDSTGGVTSLGYYSPELYTAVVNNLASAANPPASNAAPPARPSLNKDGAAQPVSIANNSEFRVQLLSPISTQTNKKGDKITAQVVSPDQFRGDTLEGTIRESKNGGKVKGKSVLNLSFDTLYHGKQLVPVSADVKSMVNSKGQQDVDEEGQIIHKKNNIGKVAAATAVGALIGGLAGGARGAAIGAGVGAAASIILVEVTVEGANVSFAPGSEFILSVKPGSNRQAQK